MADGSDPGNSFSLFPNPNARRERRRLGNGRGRRVGGNCKEGESFATLHLTRVLDAPLDPSSYDM